METLIDFNQSSQKPWIAGVTRYWHGKRYVVV